MFSSSRPVYAGIVKRLDLEDEHEQPALPPCYARRVSSQLPRVAWYVGHSIAVRRSSEAARRRDGKKTRPRALTNAPVPDRIRLYADMAILLQLDLANVEAGARSFMMLP